MAEKINKKYGKRVLFPAGQQKELLEKARLELGLSLPKLSEVVGVSVRSLTDWRREKYLMSLTGVKNICEKLDVPLPKNVEIKDCFWYVEKGANKGWSAVLKKYGGIKCDPEYRKKKWFEWWENEGKFNQNNCFIAKEIFLPKNSEKLAEFIGIILGDGGISRRQVLVTLNKNDDLKFSIYVKNLIKELFHVEPSIYKRQKDSVLVVGVSRTKLVDMLLEMGLKIGSKVRQQTGVPLWIIKSECFSKACMRGLLDTDGCFYVDRHKYKDKIYLNPGINFTNRSLPLLNFFRDNLVKFGYHPTQKTKFSIFLRRKDEIIKYFEEIGSSNPKHLNKFKNHFRHGGVL